MPELSPFAGLRFDPARVDPASVTAPPYDVITPAEREQLEAASPFNVVRLILGPLGAGPEPYRASRALLDRWTADRVIVANDAPTITVYEERFTVAGKPRRQVGVLAAVEIGDEVLPHEHTMAPVVEDRLAVIRAVEANLSPVFCLYWTSETSAADAIAAVTAKPPDLDFATSDGTGHRAWRVADPGTIDAIAKTISFARVVIADGHHRYRTARAYRDERRARDGAGPWDSVLLFLVDAQRDGPALLPIHRVVSGIAIEDALDRLRGSFEVEPAPVHDADGLAALVAGHRVQGRCYGILGTESAWIATLRDEAAARAATEGDHSDAWRDLDVALLSAFVFERLFSDPAVTFVHHPSEAAESVAARRASFAVLLPPTPVDAVRRIAEARDSMPPKSTFFVPKPRTGIVIRPLGPR